MLTTDYIGKYPEVTLKSEESKIIFKANETPLDFDLLLLQVNPIAVAVATLDHFNDIAGLAEEEIHGCVPPVLQAVGVKALCAENAFLKVQLVKKHSFPNLTLA